MTMIDRNWIIWAVDCPICGAAIGEDCCGPRLCRFRVGSWQQIQQAEYEHRRRSLEMIQEHDKVVSGMGCPKCGAARGEPCRNTEGLNAGKEIKGGHTTRFHPARRNGLGANTGQREESGKGAQ